MDGVAANNGNNNNNGTPVQCTIREQDRFMPIANVIRIMRRVLPSHAKISDDAKETIQECVSEYISFITSEANERCQREQRKTITAEDVIWAMSKLGFDDYIDPLTVFLQRYREMEGDHRGSIRGEPLPLRRTASGGGPALHPTPQHQHAMESGMFVPGMQQVFHVPPAGTHQQQVAGVYGTDMMSTSGYYYGAPYGDGGGGSGSGSFDGYAPYR